MRFLLYTVDGDASAPPSPQMIDEVGKFTEETKRAGILLATGGLAPASTRVRSSKGKVAVTDGPFTETKEALGGYYLIDARDLDHALDIAKLCPARFGGVEVRPIMVFSQG